MFRAHRVLALHVCAYHASFAAVYEVAEKRSIAQTTTTSPTLQRKMRISLAELLAGGLAACALVTASVQGSAIGIRNAQLTLASVDGSNEKVEK